MGKMKRAIGRSSVALISVFLLLGIFVLTACGKTEKQLSAIRIVKQPTTTVYVTGSDFKPDGMEVVAVYSDGKEKTVTGWICDVKKLTVDSGAFESSKTVTVSYTEQEITKSATLKVNVTNKITNAVIKTAPKTEYNAGQSFDCNGMVVTATLQNGATTDIEITPNNAKITPSGPLDRNTDKVTVSIGGYTIEVDVEISSAAYIEAESGLLNGEVPNPASTSDQGNFGLDATFEDAKRGAKLLKESEVKAKYVKQVKDAFIATLEDRTEQGIAAALKEYENSDTYKNLISSYLESDAYKNTIESYLASEDYLNDAENYHAHGDVYLGGLEQGDTVSFLFEASKAATGKIAFRLASSYLLRDNGEWTPIEIGDVQFNRLCEVYVNGIKCDIPDEAVLHGGVSPDGTPNPILWVNWKEVPLENISFEEGRNVIELKILHHGIVSPAQPAYNFAANIDSLLIIPDDGEDCVISPFDANRKMTQTVTSIAMKKNQNRVELTISGEYSEVIGYVPDLFDVTVGGIEATLVTYGEGKFTLKADVTELQVNNQHNIVVGGGSLRYSEDMTLPKSVALGLIRYSVFADASNRVVLGIDSNSLVLVDSAVIETPVITLEERDGKACFVIGGGVYTATVNGYDMNDADEAELVKEILSASIKSLYLFEVQNNPADGKLEGYDIFLSNRHVVNILDDERFEVVLDVTSLKANGVYATHFNHAKADGSFPTGSGENDLKPSIDWFETETLTLASGLSYQIVYREGFAWDCVAVTVDDTFEKRYTLGNTVRLEADKEAGKMYLVLDGGSISDNTAVYAAGVTVGNTSVSGSFVMNGGTISGNNASNDFGGGVTVIQGSFTMNGGTISGNYAAGNGGGVAVVPTLLNYGNLSAVFTMNGGTITGNRSGLSKENHSLGTSGGARTGGGVMVSGQAAKFIMNGGTISDNVAGTSISWGGGVMINTNAKAYLLGGTISGNTSPTEGGGVYMASAKVYLGAVTITGNTAGTQGGGVFCNTPANLHLVGATIIGENMSGSYLNNLFLSVSGRINCHPTGTTIDGIAVPGFYNDIRMPQIGVRRASYGSSDMIFTSGLANTSCWPGRAFFADNSNYTVAHDYTSNPNTQEARFYPLGSGQQYVSMSWEVQIDGVSTWYPINDSALLNQLGVGATAKNDIATLSYTYGEHYVSGVKAYWNNGTTDVTVLDTTKNPMGILNYFDSFGNKKLTMSDPCNFTDTKNAGTYSFTANTSVLGSANRVTKNATLIIEVKKKDVNVYIKDKTVEYGLSSVEYLNQFNDPTKGYWQVDTATPLVTGDTLTGVKLIKDFGTDSGVYYVIPDPDAMDSLKAANPNYNITFVNRGKLTVDKRTVTMLLNDDYTNYADSTKKPQVDTVDKVNDNTFLNKTENTSTKYQNENGEDQSDSQNNPLYKGGWQYDYDQAALNAAADQEAYKKEHQFLAADLAEVPFEYKFNYSSSNYHAADSDKWLNVGDYTVTVECTNNNYDVTFKNAKDNSKTTFVYSIRKADLAASLKEPSETAPKVPDYKSGTYTGTDQTIAVPDVALTIKGYQGLIDYTDESGKSTADWYKYIVHKNEDGVQTPAKPDADATDWASASSSVKKKEKGTYTVYVLVTVPNHKPVVYEYTYSLGANKIEYKIVLKQKPSATGAAAELSPEADKSVKTTYNGQTVTAEIVFAWDYDTNVQKPSTWDTDKPTLKLYYKSTDSYGYGSTDTAHPDESGTDANGQAHNLGNSQATALAGSYVVTMLNESAATSNYDLVPASGYASSVNYKIEPKEIDVPTAPSAVTYDGTEKTFNVSLTYDSTVAVKIGKLNDSSQFVEGTLPDDLTENTVGVPAKTKSYKATKAGEYGVVFQLPFDSPDGKTARNYKWKNSTKAEATVTLTISAVELRVDWKFKEDNKPLANMSASYKANVKGEISTAYRTGYVPVTVDGTQEEPQLQFYYQYIKDAQGNAVADAPKVAITITDLFKLENMKYDNAHVAGTYKIWVQLMSSEDYEQNGNYKFDEENDTYYSKEITITAGDADISGLGVQFTQNGTDYDFDKDSTKFTYSVDSEGNVLDFSFKLNFDAVDYLETDTSKYPNGIKYQKKDENGDWQDVAKVDGAGEYRVVYAIKVKDDKKDEHKLPANSDFSSDIFSDYKRDTTDTSKAEFTFPLTVGRAAVDLDGMKYEYKTAGGTWKTYDEKNLPEFTETNFEVRVKSPYPAGITAAEIEYDTDTSTNGRKGPGKIGFTVNFELDDNYHYIDETAPDHPVLKQFEHKDTVEIAPKLIGAKWKPVTLTDEDGKAITDSIVGGSGVPYQISILDVAAEYKNYIVYEYVVKDSSGNEIDVFTDIMDYINQYQPTATNPLKVTVRVKIGGDAPTVGSGENKTYTYGLKDSTGKKVDSLEKSITLGAMLDLAEVSVNMDSTVYGTAVKHDDIFSVTSNGKPMNTALYSAVLCDADGKELGAIDTIDFASLNAGIYTVQLSVDEDAGYVLSLDKFTFTIEQKELEVPEIIGEIVFNGTIIDITSRLDSNYQDYLNRGIIKIEGTVDARNAGKTYSFTISITDPNYKWKNEEPPASTLAVQLADEDAGYTITVDEQDAVYDWHINPYVLKGTLWEFTKDGAVFKVPDWVKALTEGENPTLELIVKYYDSKDSEIALEEVALKGGATFFVSAVLAGEDVYNFIFEENGTVEDGTNSSPRVSYTVPQSGASAVLGKVKEFFTQYWQVVVCGVCLLLSIIFIALIAHFENNRKKAKKQTKQYMTYSAVGVGLFGLSLSMWSYIAYGAIGLTVLLLIGVIIAKVRSKKAKTLLQDTAKDYEENKDARAAKKAQEEEQRRREEERLQREEEKRLREEEKLLREEERRQREQDREEERRIREEEREEERRRREEEREEARIAAMEKQNNGNGNGGLGGLGLGLNGMFMGMGGLNPAMGMGMQQQPIQPAMSQQPAQPPIQQPVQTQPVQQAPQPPVQTVQTVQPVQTVVASPVSQSASGFLLNDESLQQLRSDLREELRDELREEFEHQKRTEEFLEMIAESREKDRIKLEEEDRDLEERRRMLDLRRGDSQYGVISRPVEPMYPQTSMPHASYPFPYGANNGYGQYYDEQEFKIRALESKLQQMETWKYEMNRAADEKRLREIEDRQREILFREDERRMRAMEEMQRQMHYGYLPHNAPHRAEPPQPSVPPYQRPVEYVPQQPVSPQPNQSWQRQPNFTQKPYQKKQSYQSQAKQQPVVVVQQPNASTPPPAFHPGTIMTTTTTTTIDGTKSSEKENSDYEVKYSPFDRDGKYN